MSSASGILKIGWRETIFQVVVLALVFIFYCFDRHDMEVINYKVAFLSSYVVAATIINYWLLPLLLYRKKHVAFILSIIILISIVIILEEWFWEPIYFEGRRADHFPGVFFSLADILPVITILVGSKFAWDVFKKQHQLEELNSVIRESELQYLKSQINPHFLFNNLNNLYSYAIENSPKTPTIILELSSVLRYMLYECREEYVPLHKELEHLENFTKLNELQIEDRGKITFEKSEVPPGFRIAPLILIVFVENAFKHSQSSQSEDIEINIKTRITEDGNLYFECRNSFNPTTNTDKLTHGIGLENVKKRLQLMYPHLHMLEISQDKQYFTVHLHIHLNKGNKS